MCLNCFHPGWSSRPFSLHSEPHQNHQNPAERRYQTVKNATNRSLDCTGAPAHLWLLCLQYVCYLLNHTYNMSIDAELLTKLLGSTVDISPLLCFHFWEGVCYFQTKSSFSSDSKEVLGHIVGISEHCGHALTYKVLTANTGHVIFTTLSYDQLLLMTLICVPAWL
jgi:hypothetical protein